MHFLFEDFSLDTNRRELWRGGALQPVEPQVFDLLEFLIRHRERVVTKDDLLTEVWGGRAVSDSALTTRLNAARSAIGDNGKSQRLIKTLLRKGVRFVGAVTERTDADVIGEQRLPASPVDAAHPQPLAPPQDLPSVAVLPFRSVGVDRLSNYFGDGIVEDIVLSLASLHELFVISRSSTLAFRGNDLDLRAVGRALGVRYVVTGSVSRSGHRLRVWIELCDAGTGETIWTERTDSALGDLFNIQDRIVADTVARIAPHIRQAELKRALRKQPETLSAYDYTLRALDLIYRVEKNSFEEASTLPRKAQKAEPTFALPYAWAAWTHMYRVALGWSSDEMADMDEATRTADAALQLDGQNARALATYGHLKSFIHHDTDAGLHYLDSALNACPNDPFGWALSSASLSYVGRSTQSVSQAERALRLSPFDRYRFYYSAVLGLAHYVGGAYEDAVKWGRVAMRENPAFTPNLRYLAGALAAAGKPDEAKEVAHSLLQRQPNFRLRHYERNAMPLRDDQQKLLHMHHLRLAGLPEN